MKETKYKKLVHCSSCGRLLFKADPKNLGVSINIKCPQCGKFWKIKSVTTFEILENKRTKNCNHRFGRDLKKIQK